VTGSIVFRWYDRQMADEIYSAWSGAQLLRRLEADTRTTEEAAEREQAVAAAAPAGASPLGKPGVATTASLERLLRAWQAEGVAGQPIRAMPVERPSDRLLHYELICDACTQAEWRAKEAFFIRHLGALRRDTPEQSISPGDALVLQADISAHYDDSRAGRFAWQTWPLLAEGLERLEWERFAGALRSSYQADKPTRRAGVERALLENYAALETLRQRLREGDAHGWALVVYEANDERLPFPPPALLEEAMRQTEDEVDAARQAAERSLARRRRFQRVVVPVILLVVFWLLGFFFTQSFVGASLVAVVICGIVGGVVWLIVRRST
jgi:hypothetical protein